MAPGFLLSLREGMEAVLILSLVLGSLRKMNRPDLSRRVWWGASLALVVSIGTAVALNIAGSDFTDAGESAFEGLTMLLAACVLTWMIFWMQRQSRSLKKNIETNVRQVASIGSRRGLFFFSFLAVVREGLELALYLMAARLASSLLQIAVGAILGLACAFLLGWLLMASIYRINLQRFFQVTSFLLILFGAGLIANGVHELIEAGWLSVGLVQVWDLNGLLAQNSPIGQLMNSLLGYNSQPALIEVLAYLAYLAAIVGGVLWSRRLSLSGQKSKVSERV